MLERFECPEGVLGIRAVGKIQKSDYETVLEPAIQGLIDEHGEVRLVYVLGDEFDGYAASAALEDAKLGLGHFNKWKRIAIVTDHDWLRRSMTMFGWMMPGEVKSFATSELDDATAWAKA